jgi:hypothetical protein
MGPGGCVSGQAISRCADGAFMEPSRRDQWQQRQIGGPPKPQEQAKSVAVGCDWLPRPSNGEEGVDGSSPSEGFAKAPQIGAFCFERTCTISSVRWIWSPLWSLQVQSTRWMQYKIDAFARDRGIVDAREHARFLRDSRCQRASVRPAIGCVSKAMRRDARRPTRKVSPAPAAASAGRGGREHRDGECPAAHGSTMTARPVGINHPEA